MHWQLKVLVLLADDKLELDLSDAPPRYRDYVRVVRLMGPLLGHTRSIPVEDVTAALSSLSPVDKACVADAINGHMFLEKLIVFNKPLLALEYLRNVCNSNLKAMLSPMVQKGSSTDVKTFQNWGWDSNVQNSSQARRLLRENLLKLLPPDIYIATDRMETLVNDGLKYETIALPNLDSQTNLLHGNLLMPKLPTDLHKTLSSSNDEVWFIKYSPDGKYLAAASKDSKVVIYDAENDYKVARVLENHTSAVTYLTWSLDSNLLLSLSFDQTVSIYSIFDDSLFHTIEKDTLFEYPVRFTCAQFIDSDPHDNDNYKFVLASSDGKLVIIKFNSLKANIINQYKPKDTIAPQIHDLAILNDKIWTIQPNNTDLICYSMPQLELNSITPLPATPTSIIALPGSTYLLLNFKSHSAILMNIDISHKIGSPYPETLFRLPPSASTQFIVRGCIGYSSQNSREPSLVLSGSKTGQVWIWGSNGNIITVVQGHDKLVNSLAWRPGYIEWASASDDHSVCVWTR